MFKTTVFRRHAFLGTFTSVCALIGFAGYCWNGSIPILMIAPRTSMSSSSHVMCSNTTNGDGNITADTPFIASGPSKIQEVIPMPILVKRVSMKEHKGLSYLDQVSLSRYYQCQPARMLLLDNANKETKCSKLAFRDGKSPIVALVSFHGSGNTWVRYLLEQVTGVYTGSIYCDQSLKILFPGESVVSGNVIVVKTHQPDSVNLPKDVQMAVGKQKFDKAILLLRNPFDALVSEANRRWNAKGSKDRHIGLADDSVFFSTKWDWYVESKGMSWGFMLHTWLSQNTTPIHIVQYEHLVVDLQGELVKMLKFLNLEVPNETIDCVIENSEGKFRREHHLNFDPFTSENRGAVNRLVRQAAPLLASHGIKYDTR